MIFIQDRNRILKSSDTHERNLKNWGGSEENGIIKKLDRGKQKIKIYCSDKIENSAEELSENRKE